MKNLFNITSILLTLTVLVGCSSKRERLSQLEILAANRAVALSANLPIHQGPLTILKVSSTKEIVEINMLYNQDSQHAKDNYDIVTIVTFAINGYCKNPEVYQNLSQGLIYRLKIKDPRGVTLSDSLISSQRCKASLQL